MSLSFFKDDGETVKEEVSVLVVSEKLPPFNSPGHYMLEEAGGV